MQFLTANRVRPLEVFGYGSLERPEPDFAAELAPVLREEGRLHLFHSMEETIYQGRLGAYTQALEGLGRTSQVVQTHHDRSGRLIFVVGRAVR